MVIFILLVAALFLLLRAQGGGHRALPSGKARVDSQQTPEAKGRERAAAPAPVPVLSPSNNEQTVEETFEKVSVQSLLPLKGSLGVWVAKLRDPQAQNVLVSTGIPFAPGQLFSENNVAILNSVSRKEIPIAVKVLAHWPQDRSIRSVLVQFPLTIPQKYEKVILRWGEPRTAPDRPIVDVHGELPEGWVVLPAQWLCFSKVVGDQWPKPQRDILVPLSDKTSQGYEANVDKYYPLMRDTALTGDVSDDAYYDFAHTLYQLYARSNDEDIFKTARREAVAYRSRIIREGPDRGRHQQRPQTRYIYVQAMIDDYLMTGDQDSLEVAGSMAEYLRDHFEPSAAFYPKSAEHFWTEREVAFPFLGIISYYELTGDQKYLESAREIMRNLYRTQNEWPQRGGFIHNLYSHDPEEGCRRDEYGGSPFMTGLLLEAVVKYHQMTHSNLAKDSIFKAVDWLMKEALTDTKNSFVYLTCDISRGQGHPDLNMLIVHAFGYAYKISGHQKKEYLETGEAVFNEGVEKAYLDDRKHFDQNYRSSGHFLSYIRDEKSVQYINY